MDEHNEQLGDAPEPVALEEPVADEDFADAEDAAAHPEMDNEENDEAPAAPDPEAAEQLQQERVEEAAEAHEQRHADDPGAEDQA